MGKQTVIWVMDRGMISERTYGIEGSRATLHRGDAEGHAETVLARAASPDWHQVHAGLEVRFCQPWRRRAISSLSECQRKEKEQACIDRFEKRIEEGLEKIVASCRKRKQWRSS